MFRTNKLGKKKEKRSTFLPASIYFRGNRKKKEEEGKRERSPMEREGKGKPIFFP